MSKKEKLPQYKRYIYDPLKEKNSLETSLNSIADEGYTIKFAMQQNNGNTMFIFEHKEEVKVEEVKVEDKQNKALMSAVVALSLILRQPENSREIALEWLNGNTFVSGQSENTNQSGGSEADNQV